MDPTNGPLDTLAAGWLAAEDRATAMPRSPKLQAEAARLGEAYEAALQAASRDEIETALAAARATQATHEVGSAEWDASRRVAELLRLESEASAQPLTEDLAAS